MYSQSVNNLILAFKKLPSVGQRTAERFVFSLLKGGKKDVVNLKIAIDELLSKTKSCEVCWNFDDQSPCATCKDSRRDSSMICVVADPQDVAAIDKIGEYRGLYHVLRGTVEAGDEEESLKRIKVRELFLRLNKQKTNEVILALNSNMSGEVTMLYIEREMKKLFPTIKVTRLARGLPIGSDLQYADEITLGSALKNRTSR